MKIKKGLFSVEIDIKPGEFTEFAYQEKAPFFVGLMQWLKMYLLWH